MKANKYKIGKLARKHLLTALELILDGEQTEDSLLIRFKKYEIRAKKKPHGVTLDWARHGTFYDPLNEDIVTYKI